MLRTVIDLTMNEKLKSVLEAEITTLDLLKQAYTASRYLPVDYDREAVKRALKVVEAVLGELGIP